MKIITGLFTDSNIIIEITILGFFLRIMTTVNFYFVIRISNKCEHLASKNLIFIFLIYVYLMFSRIKDFSSIKKV